METRPLAAPANATPPSALNALRERLQLFVSWPVEDKGLFLAVFASLGVFSILAALLIGRNTPMLAGYINPEALSNGIRVVQLFLVGSLILAGIFFRFIWRRERAPATVRLFLHFALFAFMAELFYVVYLIGFLSAGILIIVATVCITRFAYDRALGAFVLTLSVVGILGLTILQATGQIQYAPAFVTGIGAMFKHPIVLWAATIAVLAVLGLLYGMLDFIASRMYEMLTTDGLTSVSNRRHFMTMLGSEFQRAVRHGRSLSILIIDVDHFKRVNDTFGHGVGDDVLKSICRLVRQEVRALDLVGRIGGEEFAVLLPETNALGALQLAERCRERVGSTPLNVGERQVGVTLSIGVACLSASCIETMDNLTLLADQALYKAKQEGRNRCVVA